MATLYKLTDENMQTYRGFQWTLGVTRETHGEGPLCSSAWLHAYTDPLLAVLLNPIHANIYAPRLFECEGEVGIMDDGLKVGCRSLTLVRELLLPAVTTEQRVRFAILCALKVYSEPTFKAWAEAWLAGTNRLMRAAEETAQAAQEAGEMAAWAAAWAAAGKTEETAAWASATAAAEWASATAAAEATWAAPLWDAPDLIALAHEAMAS